MMLLWVLVIFTQLEGGSAADGIQPLFLEQHVLEGADVSLSCNYSGAGVQGFQWYRQYPGSSPEFLLYIYPSGGGSAADGIQPLFSEQHVLEGADVSLSCNYSGTNVQNFQWYRQYPGSSPENLLVVVSEPESRGRLKAEVYKNLNRLDLKISSAAVSDSCLLLPCTPYGPAGMFWVIIVFVSDVSSYELTPLPAEVHVLEGSVTVTLSWSYSGTNILAFQWYRQNPNSAPEYFSQAFENRDYHDNGRRITVHKDLKRLDLEMFYPAQSDSALYYCTLVTTVTGKPPTLYRNTTQADKHSKHL
ncbi:hypothetical protein NFI96_029829 [Prochilodus magdalenae]|nr:hypothetical protein NFI96_029829 [Prochilodus magdalenae]